MVFEEEVPGDLLGKFVDKIIYFKDFTPDHSIERLVPTGNIFLVIELDGFERQVFDNQSLGPLHTYKNAWISGMQSKFVSISAHEKSEMVAIQFKPLGAAPFFRLSNLEYLKDKIVQSEQVFGSQVIELRNLLLAAETPKVKFELVLGWLQSRFKGEHVASDALQNAVKLVKERVDVDIELLAARSSISHKHFISECKRKLGMTPKLFQRILRFHALLKDIEAETEIEWARLALDWGFTDQSHLIREFYLFSGFRPKEFVEKDLHQDGSNFFPIQ